MSADQINDLVNFVSDSRQYIPYVPLPQQMPGQYCMPYMLPQHCMPYMLPQQIPGQYYMPLPQQIPEQYYMPQLAKVLPKRTRSRSPPRFRKCRSRSPPPRTKYIKTPEINYNKICGNIVTDIGWVDQKAFDKDIDSISLSPTLCSEFSENTIKYRKQDDLYIKYFVRYENHTIDSCKIINTKIFYSFLNKLVGKNKKLKSFEVRYYIGTGFRHSDQKLFNANTNDGFLMVISFILV